MSVVENAKVAHLPMEGGLLQLDSGRIPIQIPIRQQQCYRTKGSQFAETMQQAADVP